MSPLICGQKKLTYKSMSARNDYPRKGVLPHPGKLA